MKFFDIGANLTDPVFRGIYREKQKHEDDFEAIMARAKEVGLVGHMVTGGSLSDSKEALTIAKERSDCYSTCGVHPTRCSEFEENDSVSYFEQLTELAKNEKVLAIGECGLDYDRLRFCPKEVQLKWFEKQLELSKKTDKPLFLHLREYSAKMKH